MSDKVKIQALEEEYQLARQREEFWRERFDREKLKHDLTRITAKRLASALKETQICLLAFVGATADITDCTNDVAVLDNGDVALKEWENSVTEKQS